MKNLNSVNCLRINWPLQCLCLNLTVHQLNCSYHDAVSIYLVLTSYSGVCVYVCVCSVFVCSFMCYIFNVPHLFVCFVHACTCTHTGTQNTICKHVCVYIKATFIQQFVLVCSSNGVNVFIVIPNNTVLLHVQISIASNDTEPVMVNYPVPSLSKSAQDEINFAMRYIHTVNMCTEHTTVDYGHCIIHR